MPIADCNADEKAGGSFAGLMPPESSRNAEDTSGEKWSAAVKSATARLSRGVSDEKWSDADPSASAKLVDIEVYVPPRAIVSTSQAHEVLGKKPRQADH